MEKRLRSSLKTSAEEFLISATKLGFRSSKPSLKTLIHSINSSSPLVSALPISLHLLISQSIEKYNRLTQPGEDGALSPQTPPTKRVRRSSRKKNDAGSGDVDDGSEKRGNVKKFVVESLQIYAYVASMCVSHPKKVFLPADLLPAVSLLHDNLILFECDSNLLSDITNLCEEWWKEELPGRETLISQSLPFLLSRSLTLKKKVDVHRVYMLREAFTLFDFEDDSIEDLKLLLIRCLIAPLYLKMDDGRKFLAFLFGLSRQLVKEALAMIRSQIPFGRKSMLEAYADIIFRAWSNVDSECREVIENDFLQGLIESSIHASTESLCASIRRILAGFISQRTTDGVEKLLFRLAEPVIFRSLQVANSNVRQNALLLLIDLFPLEDPDATREVKNSVLDRQFFLMERLLMDECPEVRVVAVEGSCRILHLFWEIIQSSTITKIITKIFDDMSHDMCNEVRLSTVNGVIYLLGNPQSHEILKVLLPRLGHLILDSALSIRAATLDLLLLLKDIRSFQFHKVVQLDQLLTTLANDQSLVAQKITKLLIPSYFPSKVTPEEASSRCITLIKRSPLAGARFCEFALSEEASQQFLLKLFKAFTNLVLSPDKLTAEQVDGLLVAAAHLCTSLASETSFKAALKEELSSEKLKCLFAATTTGLAQSSLCKIVSSISPDAVDVILEDCMTLLRNCAGLSDNEEKQAEVRSVHKMILSCDFFEYMLEDLTKSLQRTAQECHTKFGTETTTQLLSTAKRRKIKSHVKVSEKSKSVSAKKYTTTASKRFGEDYEIAVGIAWQLKDLLRLDDTRKAILGSKFLESAFYALKVISEVSILQCLQCDYMNSSPVIAYTSLSLHISLENVKLKDTNNQCLKMKNCLDSTGSFSEKALLEQTIDHLLNCTDKLFRADKFWNQSKASSGPGHAETSAKSSGKKHTKPRADDSGHKQGAPDFTAEKKISAMVKMMTAILKFIADSSTMHLVSQYQESCLVFTRKYVEFVISILRESSLEFKEEDLKELFLYLKSSFTYAAKLLNVILTNSSESSPPPLEAYYLANKLIDQIISVEGSLGSGYGARMLSAAKQWVPDLILALGSAHMQKQSSVAFNKDTVFPSWPTILAKLEVKELSEADTDNEEGESVSKSLEFSSFRKLMEMMIQQLRANHSVLDAVGTLLLTSSAVGLERDDFELLLGLLHFVCSKLAKHENGEWEDLNLMLKSIEKIYPRIERLADELGNNDGKQKVESARVLLEPVWSCYNGQTCKEPMETDFTAD